MIHWITFGSKYFMIVAFFLYAFECFHVFSKKLSPQRQMGIYRFQRMLIFLIHAAGYLVIYWNAEANGRLQVAGFYLMQVVLFAGIYLIYYLFYKKSSHLVLNNMVMLLAIGMIIICRISFDKAFKQFLILASSSLICLLIPEILSTTSGFFRKLKWLYGLAGIAALSAVLVLSTASYGAKLSLKFGVLSLQPAEFVKIIFVFFVASMFRKSTKFGQVFLAAVFAGIQVLLLVASKDLGQALLFYITFLLMLYAASRNVFYFAGGLLFAVGASIGAYQYFDHVRVRVVAWQDPLKVFHNEGYQLSQSLFRIGTGGWLGLGLYQGNPAKIPVVEKDFVFSAISEELGGLFALCLMLLTISCFLMMQNIAMQMKDPFYKLVALGLGTLYGFQNILTIGGAVRFIPSTGVTLPLVSYGGSSLMSTMIIFGTVQGLYIMKGSKPVHEKEKGTG